MMRLSGARRASNVVSNATGPDPAALAHRTVSVRSWWGVRAMGMLLLCGLGNASEQDRDRIIMENQRTIHAVVYHETGEGIQYKTSPVLPQMQNLRWSRIDRVIYHGMEGNGLFAVGMDEMNAGQFEQAAGRFKVLAMGDDKREWERAYGWFYEGVAWERAGLHEQAAEAFGTLVDTIPDHRLATDALYRLGINLAQAEDYAGAQAAADRLETRYQEERDRGAQQRARAVETAIAANQGDMDDAIRLSRRVTLGNRDGDTYLHWGEFWADLLMGQERYADAANAYNRLLRNSDADPVATAGLNLGYGIALAKDGVRDQALTALMRLDALPYGSPSQRLQARYWIGRLLWDLSQANADNERERVARFAADAVERARRMLQSVAHATLDHPHKRDARILLEEMPDEQGAAAGDEGENEVVEDGAAPAAVAE